MGDSMGSSMSMSMTFGSFSDYQLQLLFSSWDIETRAQLAGAWFAVFFAVIVSHGLRYYISIVEQDMRSVNAKLTLEGVGKETSSLLGGQSPFVKGTSTIYEKIKLKLVHASLSAVNYGVRIWISAPVFLSYLLSSFFKKTFTFV